jgi:hypothetical protein
MEFFGKKPFISNQTITEIYLTQYIVCFDGWGWNTLAALLTSLSFFELSL